MVDAILDSHLICPLELRFRNVRLDCMSPRFKQCAYSPFQLRYCVSPRQRADGAPGLRSGARRASGGHGITSIGLVYDAQQVCNMQQ